MISLEQCSGCRDDFYNGHNSLNVKRCWNAKTGRMVTRYRIGTWTRPTEPKAFTEVRVPSCFNQTGEHFYDRLPNFVKLEDVVRRTKTAKARSVTP
jgi:hypothetical protein